VHASNELERTVISRVRAASARAALHYARAARWIRFYAEPSVLNRRDLRG
jgi:hypothetical protein